MAEATVCGVGSCASRSPADEWADVLPLLRCPDCRRELRAGGPEALACSGCARVYPIREGFLDTLGELRGNNQVAAEFYDGPLWPKFRFWEFFTFFLNGGVRRSRRKVMRHLGELSGTRLLEVAIGDGSNLPLIPPDCEVYGNDISIVQLRQCRRKFPDRRVHLILGEAESLPFADQVFDNVLSFGAFNYFNDPLGALREMARVVKPDGRIVVSDEYPSLPNRMIGYWIGLPQIDRWFMSRVMRLGPKFTEMVERHRHMKLEPIFDQVLEDWKLESVWGRLGYVVVGRPKQPLAQAPAAERRVQRKDA